MKIRKFIFLALAVLIICMVYLFFFPGPTFVHYPDNRVVVSTVTCGLFNEYIPQTGIFDSTSGNVKVMIDEMYLSKISFGAKATTEIESKLWELRIVKVDDVVSNGRFNVVMNFRDCIPSELRDNMNLRLRVELSEPYDALLLPIGGFYRDTRGKWVYVIKGDSAFRRDIKLGKKAGSEYFEVLSGLSPGEKVITSTYQNIPVEEVIDLNSISDTPVIKM